MAKKNTKKSEMLEKPARTRRSEVELVVAALARVVDGDRKAAEANRKRAALFGSQIQKLIGWGKAELAMSPDEAYDLATELQREGFEPPKGAGARAFSVGDAVQIREKFRTEYQRVYTADQLDSMVYSIRDDVTGTVICTTSGKMILTRAAHIERRAVDVLPE
jgi:hypothetical protein